MNKDDRNAAIFDQVTKIQQYESGYAQLQNQINYSLDAGLKSSRDYYFYFLIGNP